MKRQDPELRVFDVTQPLTAKHAVKSLPKRERHPAPTPEETLKVLRQMKGGEAVIKRVPKLLEPISWTEEAHWEVNKISGAALDLPFLWDCDFPGGTWTMFDAYANGIAYFTGTEDLGGVIPPPSLSGKVWCYFETPAYGLHIFVPQVQTYPDQYYGPDYQAYVEFGVDETSFGSWNISSGAVFNSPLFANISAGLHRFYINQVVGAFFFEGLSMYRIGGSEGPLDPAPPLP